MDAQKSKELEEAIEFGQTISSIGHIVGHGISILTSDWSDKFKITIANELDSYKKWIQNIVETVDKKYAGIKVAEDAKVYAQKTLAKFEEVARPYLK